MAVTLERSLDVLSSGLYGKVCIVIARCAARGVALMVVQTLRTPEEHAQNLANGTSKVSASKHLPRHLRGILDEPDACDAIDLVPYEIYALHGPDKLNYNGNDPAFGIIGEEAEALGLRWGGRWLDPVDPGHIELVFPADSVRWAAERQRAWPYPTVTA